MKNIKYTKEVKCIVWDLDNTIWDGILSESEDVQLKPQIKDILIEFDSRGILHSIASKNNYRITILRSFVNKIQKKGFKSFVS